MYRSTITLSMANGNGGATYHAPTFYIKLSQLPYHALKKSRPFPIIRNVGTGLVPVRLVSTIIGQKDLILDHNLVDITPAPVFARLEGLYDRVAGSMEVFGGVLVL